MSQTVVSGSKPVTIVHEIEQWILHLRVLNFWSKKGFVIIYTYMLYVTKMYIRICKFIVGYDEVEKIWWKFILDNSKIKSFKTLFISFEILLQVYLLKTWPTFVLVVYASNEFLAGFFGISETWVRHVTVLKVRRRF